MFYAKKKRGRRRVDPDRRDIVQQLTPEVLVEAIPGPALRYYQRLWPALLEVGVLNRPTERKTFGRICDVEAYLAGRWNGGPKE